MAWIPFNGKAKQTSQGWQLAPAEDDDARIYMDANDVRKHPDGRVYVLVGSRAKSIDIPSNSPINIDPEYLSIKTCPNKSRCAGGIEFCCSDEISGTCHGKWNECDSFITLKRKSKIEETIMSGSEIA